MSMTLSNSLRHLFSGSDPNSSAALFYAQVVTTLEFCGRLTELFPSRNVATQINVPKILEIFELDVISSRVGLINVPTLRKIKRTWSFTQ